MTTTPDRVPTEDPVFELRRLQGHDEALACAAIMSTSEPWITLGRDHPASLAVVLNPDREVWVAVHDGTVTAFVVLAMRGGFPGYIQSIGVEVSWRGRGIGRQLLERVEHRVFEETPNVFLCVSSFNPGARRFYEAGGYRHVGTVPDYIVAGHDEHIMRKTCGPLAGYRSAETAG
ncbi:MAG: GNAT family N-acetyltransferase [Gemmatimonadaceae bacterium]